MHSPGHTGLALIVAFPFVIIGLLVGDVIWGMAALFAAMTGGHLPDIDQYKFFPGRHRGFTHTYLFAALLAPILGASVTFGVHSADQIFSMADTAYITLTVLEIGVIFVLTSLAGLFGIISHIWGDALSKAYGSVAVKPNWPFDDDPLVFAKTTAENPIYNYGFLAIGVALNAPILLYATDLG